MYGKTTTGTRPSGPCTTPVPTRHFVVTMRDLLGEPGHRAHGENSGVLPVVKVGDVR